MVSVYNLDSNPTGENKNLIGEIPDVRLNGLGNIASRTAGDGIDPSANVNIEYNLGKYKNSLLSLGFNLGNQLDSSYIDSVGLADIFYPDRSRIGFTGVYALDLFRINFSDKFSFRDNTSNMTNVATEGDSNEKFHYWSLSPTIEYSYQRRNFVEMDSIEVNRVQTSTWVFGLRLWHKKHIKDNVFGFTVYPYYKKILVTDGTLDTYRLIFNEDNGGKELTQHATILGVSLGALVNDILISFNYEELLTEQISNKDVGGGVFIIKASIAAEFFGFK